MSRMTLTELSRHFKLRMRLERNEEMLEFLQAAACPGAQNLDGMPHASGLRDRVGDLATEIADLKGRIRYLRNEIAREKRAVIAFIRTIDDEQLRIIFRLRFIRCLTWGEVAGVIGGRNTEEGVKAACYRYLASKSCNGLSPRDA